MFLTKEEEKLKEYLTACHSKKKIAKWLKCSVDEVEIKTKDLLKKLNFQTVEDLFFDELEKIF